MSNQIGAYEARTRLAELLRRVEAGERFTITVRGSAVAELVPAVGKRQAAQQAAVEGMQRIKRIKGIGTPELLGMIAQGRR